MSQGLLTPRRMLERMTAREYAELRTLAGEELIGQERDDARMAMVGYALHRAWGGQAEFRDFIPRSIEHEQHAQSLDEMELALRQLIPVKNNGNPGDNQHQGGS